MVDKTCRVSVDELNHDLEQGRLEAKQEREYEARKWATFDSVVDAMTFDYLLEIMAEFSEAEQAKIMKLHKDAQSRQLGERLDDLVVNHILDKIDDDTIPLILDY